NRSGERALRRQPTRRPAPNHVQPRETLGNGQGRESGARHQDVPRREARTLPHRRGDCPTQPGSDERARLALARLFSIEPLARNAPRRTHYGPLGRHDFAQAVWRIPNTKSGRPHLLPLPRPALQILEGLPSRHSSEWLFPGEKTNTSITAPSNAWQRIRKRAGLNGDDNVPNTAVRQHDLRRTLGSWLAASGYSLPLIGRALNHANVSTTAIYARLDLDPVRRALEDNATMMLAAGKQTVDTQTKRSSNTQGRQLISEV